jgi:formylglycine-generating enzyme required for sulfatase activity
MGQGGNVYEWNESAFDGTNNLSDENRAIRGGNWASAVGDLRSSDRGEFALSNDNFSVGFRVASVPEPSTYALLALAAAGFGARVLRRRRK